MIFKSLTDRTVPETKKSPPPRALKSQTDVKSRKFICNKVCIPETCYFISTVLTQGAHFFRCSTGVKLTDDIELINGGRFVTFSFRSFR